MKYLKLFEEMEIEQQEFPHVGGHDLSIREENILYDLVGEEYLDNIWEIRVEDHYYYTEISDSILDHRIYYNRFDSFNQLKDYILSYYYMDNNKPEELLEFIKTSKFDPSVDDNRAIWWASLRRNKEIIKLLLNDQRVRDKLTEWGINKYTNETS